MWTVEHSTVTTASAKALWSIWTNPKGWPESDQNLEWARLDGPFAVGEGFCGAAEQSPRLRAIVQELRQIVALETFVGLCVCL